MRTFGKAMLLGAMALVFSIPPATTHVSAQSGENSAPVPVAVGDRVYCAGYISENKPNGDIRIVASPNSTTYLYVNGQRAFINKGKADGIQVGDVYQVIRPLGEFYHPFKTKLHFPDFGRRGEKLGYYTEEIGFVRVIAVQDNTSTIEVSESCSEARLGDALVKFEKPKVPDQRAFTPLNPLSGPNGKMTAQIILARSGREQLAASDVITLDVGEKAGVKVGDYFTIFREAHSEPITKFYDDEVSFKHVEAGSERFRGNDRSILHPSIQKEKLDKKYPGKVLPRTVVGEVVVIRVEGTTATAIVTRTQTGEAFLGDFVELQ